MTQEAFLLAPISPEAAATLRAKGGPMYVADEYPSYPCRQCLRDAIVGEELILVSYDPFVQDSAYRSATPIFLHREPCERVEEELLPDQLTGRQLSVRSFDQREMMIDAAVIDGADLAGTIRGFFANEASDKLHVHNASRGCWAVSVVRQTS